MSTTIQFSETQSPPRGLRIISYSIAGFVAVFSIVIWFVMREVDPPMSTTETIWFFISVLAVPALLLLWFNSVKQIVTITDDTITVFQRGVHFKPKVINRSDVTSMTVRKLNAFGEFGGWGIRYGFNKKWGYIWGGSSALDLHMKDGKRIVISIVDADALSQQHQQLRSTNNPTPH